MKGIEVARSSAIFASFESGIEKMQNHRIQGARMRLPNVTQIKAFASKDSLNGLKYSVQGWNRFVSSLPRYESYFDYNFSYARINKKNTLVQSSLIF